VSRTPNIVLESARLALRELTPADIDFVAELLGDPLVMRYWPRPFTRAEAVEWIERQQARYAEHGHGYWLALDRATGEPVGQLGLLMSEVDGTREPALGYILRRERWGAGLGAEGAQACLDWGFRRGYARILCLIRPENAPSLRVAQRLGLRRERETVYADLRHVVFVAARGEAGRAPSDHNEGSRPDPRAAGP
jgi:RimJ/RimL family protein N-acetyltransferase